ncbi:MAG: NAD(P)H-hydrate dehydratase [Deltaproteobacteria bacterium]|nr:MAG: NAD(P)H-hydrate dehydratase [Deltaproteobacteria bacterium]
MYLVTAAEMRAMDRQTIESFGIPGRVLMENAGRGATRVLLEQFPSLEKKRIGIVAGRGNNGGDGFVIARYLAHKNINVTVFLLAEQQKVSGDAAANLKLLAPLSVPVVEVPDQKTFSRHRKNLVHQDIWIDAILGTGLNSEVKGYYKGVIDFINDSRKPVFAVDIPSGLNSDTGQSCGIAIKAQVTATFAFAKTGHTLFPGASYTGKLEIIDIGIPPHIAAKVGPKQYLLTPDLVRSVYEPRLPDIHKGNTGHLLVVSGSPGKTGAAAMTAMSAMRAGAGLVTLGIPRSLNPVLESQVIEAMTWPLPETLDGGLDEASFDQIMTLLADKKCLAIGPGIGQAEETKKLVQRLVEKTPVTVVMDADGINNLAGNVEILKRCKVAIILTPHPGEMARLIHSTPREIQKDRVACARNFAVTYNVHLVLKGARTVIAHPDGRVFINSTGNSGMASGGMGDVLTGVIAGFVSQGYSPESAAHIGVYLHGAAADTLAERIAPFGYLATEVMNAIPAEIKALEKHP